VPVKEGETISFENKPYKVIVCSKLPRQNLAGFFYYLTIYPIKNNNMGRVSFACPAEKPRG